jgi:hypothetical protein
LLALSGRLADLLIARDAVMRLARRDALGPDWMRTFDQGAISGALGNELAAHMAYHTMAGLHALTAIADNLAWIMRRRSGEDLRDDDRSSSFAKLMTSDGRVPESVRGRVESLQGLPAVTVVLGLLRLRNVFAHRDGIDYGILSTETMTIPPRRQVAAMWFEPSAVGKPVRFAGGEANLFDAIAEHATFAASGQLVAFTFPDFMAVLVRTALSVTNEILSKPAWHSSRKWLLEAQARTQQASTRRLWRSGHQRRLLGL